MISGTGRLRVTAVRISLLSIVSAIAALVLASCGLVRTISLFPPNEDQIDDELSGESRFIHNTDNAIYGDAFQGYELYYKVYGISVSQRDLLETDENAVLDPDFEARPRLENRGFQRLRWEPNGGRRQRPIVDLVDQREVAVEVELNFAELDSNGPFVEWRRADDSVETRVLRRTVAPGESKDFTTNPNDYTPADHDDVDAGADDGGDGGFQIVVYVLAYGIDPEELVAIYSFEARRVLPQYVLAAAQ